MVYLRRGESIYDKKQSGNILRVEYISADPNLAIKVEEVKGTPQTIVKNIQVGRPRIVPYENVDNVDLKSMLGVTIKGMSAEQRRAYNRLAQRKRQAKEDMMKLYGETAESFKESTGKKIKDFNSDERKIYYKLNKKESRLLNKIK